MQSKENKRLVTNFLDMFTIYTDPDRTHPLIGNDVLNLTDHNNELDLYIQVDDLIDGFNIYQRILSVYGPIFLDMGRYYETSKGIKFFRDFSLVEKIDVQVHFDTKPLLLNVLEKMKDLFLIQTVIFWKYFDLGDGKWEKISVGTMSATKIIAYSSAGLIMPKYPVHKFSDIITGEKDKHEKPIPLLKSKVYKKPILMLSPPGKDPHNNLFGYYPIPKDFFAEWFFKPNNPVKAALKDKTIIKFAFNRILYYDGLLGSVDYNLQGNIRPTLYDYMDLFKDPKKVEENSSYYFGQVKHELYIRWDKYLKTSGINVKGLKFKAYTKKIFFGDYTYYTKLYGLGLMDTKQEYDYLKQTFSTKDNVGGKGHYFILDKPVKIDKKTGKINKQFSVNHLYYSAAHGDGYVETPIGKKLAFAQGSGLEAPLCASYREATRELGQRDTFLFKAFPIETGYKSFSIIRKLPTSFALKVENVTEFYDREHSSPFDGISSYTAIPLTFSNYPCSEAYLFNYLLDKVDEIMRPSIKHQICFDGGIRVEKRKFVENDNGSVAIKYAGSVSLGSGDFEIPFNKNEYAYKIFIDNAIKTWFSKDMYVHIKIKFKRTPQYRQNFVLRLFHDDMVFATEQLIKRNTDA